MQHTITIIDNRRTPLHQWVRFTASVFLLVLLPIVVGALLNSAAMQWVGFVFLFLCFGGVAVKTSGLAKAEGMTIQQARFHLDKIERGEA